MTESAVFSGAGISGEAPASLPRGFKLRNDLLRVVHDVATKVAPADVSDGALAELVDSQRKLEVVLGRLWGSVGEDALRCLLALRLEVPNAAHLLAAVHLARGGIHATLNFDVGIELAHDLLTGRAELPSGAPPEYQLLLPLWRRLVPHGVPPLRVVASRDEFAAWVMDGKPPALLKIHGSLSLEQHNLIDIVVVDTEELGQLPVARRAAIDALGHADRLLITGYSGADPDVYEPLLATATAVASSWCCYSLHPDSPVPRDTVSRAIRLRLGAPEGLAVTGLRELLDLPNAPAWPELRLPGESYEQRFDQWAAWLRGRHSPEAITQAWAWLLADGGDLDTAERILHRLTARDGPEPLALLRHAEVLYSRARSDDRDRAALLYRRIGTMTSVDSGTRYHCVLRVADIARGRATRGPAGPQVLLHLLRATSGPIRVLLATRGGRRDTESAADAYRALQQTWLRVLERAAGAAPRPLWPILAVGCRAVSIWGGRAEALAANGNRRALVRQQRMLLTALAAVLAHRQPPTDLQQRLQSLHDTYANADDLPGAGNCTATLAVVAAARQDLAYARELLGSARREYATGRPDGTPVPSGEALLTALHRLLDRLPAGA
jgi:hypothetical protein